MKAITLAALVIGCTLLPAARAADRWVARRGLDNVRGGSRDRPWATLQFAADHVQPGDTVHVRDGDYVGFHLTRSGEPDAPVRFLAEGNAVRIMERNSKTLDGINVEGANFVVIEGFLITGMPRMGIRVTHSRGSILRRIRADRNRNCGIYTSFCDDVLIESNVTSNSLKEHGIYVSNSGDRPVIRKNQAFRNRSAGIHMNGDLSQGGDGLISMAVVEENVVHHNGAGGASAINCDGVQGSVIRNNLLYGNLSSGISLFREDGAAGSAGNRVVNNTIVQPSRSRWAVNIKNESTHNRVFNNILVNAGPRGSINVSADSLPGLESDHNIVTDRFSADDGESITGLKAWRSATGLDDRSLASEPSSLFADPSADDYHLRKGSPAVDAADPSFAPRTDIEGTARPIGPRPDAGAYEAGEGMANARGMAGFPWVISLAVACVLLIGARGARRLPAWPGHSGAAAAAWEFIRGGLPGPRGILGFMEPRSRSRRAP
jgi:parallel beta-helix repeat protein